MLRAITRSLGSLESALMMLSVMPSLKYSMSGLAPALVNGRTASESMALRDERARLNGDESEVEVPKGRVGLCSESAAGGRRASASEPGSGFLCESLWSSVSLW